ncbi:MAG: MetQ/NlpA family ABC transporter substrate-binding protein [Firmicutes bacterium]|nr:MetQ/NlpA family ABC transporter substrate-binding protein [Bacillota bacterium]
MRRWLTVVVLGALLAACSGLAAAQTTVLRVGASTLPHAPILEFVKPMLAEEGIELEIVEFSDYVLPNLALADGDIDANFFQHIPYLEDFAASHGLELTWTEKVFLAPIGLYSNKIDSIDQLSRGAQIAIPNDVTNGGRALALLAQAGLLKLREGVGSDATVLDIVDNPLNLRIIELEAPLLPRALDDVDAAFINQTYALEAGLKPTEDAILLEGGDSPYANVVAARKDNADDPAIRKLGEVLTRPEVRDFILEYFEGSLIPVF